MKGMLENDIKKVPTTICYVVNMRTIVKKIQTKLCEISKSK